MPKKDQILKNVLLRKRLIMSKVHESSENSINDSSEKPEDDNDHGSVPVNGTPARRSSSCTLS